jgi:acetyl-CoA acyltransferase
LRTRGQSAHAEEYAAGRSGRGGDFALLEKASADSPGSAIDDVILGCANPEAESGMNMARVAALRAGCRTRCRASPSTASVPPACRRSRWRRTGFAPAARRLLIAGGAESMSLMPMSGHKFAPNPWMVDHIPQIYMGMGLTAEEVYRKYDVSREDPISSPIAAIRTR